MDCQRKLEELLLDLSRDDVNVEQSEKAVFRYTDAFCILYAEEGFRHHYSGVSRCLYGETTPQTEEDFRKIFRRADRLVINLGTLKEYVERHSRAHYADSTATICRKYGKLYDHVDLEYSRLLLLESPYRSFDQLAGDIDGVKKEADALGESIASANERLSSSQKDYIAILAIFAAVIMAFSGGFNFIASSLDSIARTDVAKLSCIVALVGLALINLLYVLLRFVWGIVRKEGDRKGIPRTAVVVIVANVLLTAVFLLCFVVSEGLVGSFL